MVKRAQSHFGTQALNYLETVAGLRTDREGEEGLRGSLVTAQKMFDWEAIAMRQQMRDLGLEPPPLPSELRQLVEDETPE